MDDKDSDIPEVVDIPEVDPFSELRQPSLAPSDSLTRYRILFLPTFRRATSVMIAQTDTIVVRIRQLDGEAGFPDCIGRLVRDEEKTMSLHDFSNIETLVEKAGFWEMPSELAEDVGGLDGASWTFEAVKNGRHRQVVRREVDTDPEDPFGRLCRALLAFADPPQPWWRFWRHKPSISDGY